MHSQNNEEEIILNYFNNYGGGNGGKFADIGAFDPRVFSNTRALYERGWTGVYVEPSPICFEKFKKEYANEMRIQLLNYAICEHDGFVTLYESNGDAVSTTDISHKVKWEQNSQIKYNAIHVPAMSMSNLLSKFGQDVDFLSLDTESTNYQLFNLLPSDFLHRLKMICIEHDGFHMSMESKLNSFGFRKLLLNNENLIMAK